MRSELAIRVTHRFPGLSFGTPSTVDRLLRDAPDPAHPLARVVASGLRATRLQRWAGAVARDTLRRFVERVVDDAIDASDFYSEPTGYLRHIAREIR